MPTVPLRRWSLSLTGVPRNAARTGFCILLLMVPALYAVHADEKTGLSDPTPMSARIQPAAYQKNDEGFHSLEQEHRKLENDQERLRAEENTLEGRHQEALKQQEALLRSTGSRLTALYKFRQLRYAFPLLLGDSGGGGAAQSAYFIQEILQSDHGLLLRLRETGEDARRTEEALKRTREQEKRLEEHLAALEVRMSASREETVSLPGPPASEDEGFSAAQRVRLEETQRSLERKAFSRKPITLFGEKPFSARQGHLPLPTRGDIVDSFAARSRVSSNSLLYNRGIIIQAPQGQPVYAVHDGIVVFADGFKEYGNVIILDHGEHYHSLMAHAERLLKKAGDVVKGGEAVATVGDTGTEEEARLYFEIRHFGKAVDPMEWVAVQKSSN